MNRTAIRFVFIFILLVVFPSMAFSVDQKSDSVIPVAPGVPAAYLASDHYTFKTVLEGEKVEHDFIIKNKGTAPLQIVNVQTSCGCTTASFTKEILPGGSGKVSLVLNTAGFGGRSVNKETYVETSDVKHPPILLTMTGAVEAFANIEPARAVLSGSAGDEIKTEITITPNKNFPFKITSIKAANGGNINFDLKKIKVARSFHYVLSVVNMRKTKGKYNDSIVLKTDNEIRPEIVISVFGDIKVAQKQPSAALP